MIIKYKVFYSRTIIITTSTIHTKLLAMTFSNLQRIDLNILSSIVSNMFYVNIFSMYGRPPNTQAVKEGKVNLGNFLVLSTNTQSVTHLIGRKNKRLKGNTLRWLSYTRFVCICIGTGNTDLYLCSLADFRLFVLPLKWSEVTSIQVK